MMELYSIYHNEIPDFCRECADSDSLMRLSKIDMNCGVNLTSFPLFKGIQPYSRYQHSIGVALICYHFTHDISITLAGLFHDCATPAFSHTVDFLNGDYERQESTENDTKLLIQNDKKICSFLKNNHIRIEDVWDYHQYEIADNPLPQLSADRLEYTFGNAINYGFVSKEDIRKIYSDIVIGRNEYGKQELVFKNIEYAKQLAELALRCGEVYVSETDRFAMECLSNLLRECIDKKILKKSDLWENDAFVIQKIMHSDMKHAWNQYCGLCSVKHHKNGIIIPSKKRYIDPFVENHGRLSKICNTISDEIQSFLNKDMNEKLIGVCEDGKQYNCSSEWKSRENQRV